MRNQKMTLSKYQARKITSDPDSIAAAELRRRLWVWDEMYYLYKRQLANPPYFIKKGGKDLDVPEPAEPKIKGIDVFDLRKRINVGKLRMEREKKEKI